MDNLKMKAPLFILIAAVFFFSPIASAKGGFYLCNGKTANTGQTMDEVQNSIGPPDRIEQAGANTEAGTESEFEAEDQPKTSPDIVKWYYTCDPRTYVFLFQNGTLISIYQINVKDSQ